MIVSSEAELPRPARAAPPALLALVAPDLGMERQARIGGALLPFLIAFGCALLVAFSQAARVDGRSAALKKLEQGGQLQTMSEKQIEDETRSAERLFQVGRVASGALQAPLQLGGLSLAVLGLVWFLRGKVKGRAVVPVAAAALLPDALADLLDAGTALAQKSLPIAGATLAPRNLSAAFATFGHALQPPWVKLGNAFDLFSLWGAVLLAFGVAAAGEIPVRRALWTTLVAWLCWRLLAAVAMGG